MHDHGAKRANQALVGWDMRQAEAPFQQSARLTIIADIAGQHYQAVALGKAPE
jgi:hypothetical protein